MIELNLLPDIKKEFIKAQRTRNTVISLSILATIVAGGLTFLLVSIVYAVQPLWIKAETSNINKSAQALRDIPEIDKYLTVQNQLTYIKGLHDEKPGFSRLFGYLQQLNPSSPHNIALNSASVISSDLTIELQGTARNFQGVNVFKNTLENAQLTYKSNGEDKQVKLFERVDLVRAGLSDVSGNLLATFEIEVEYAPEAFDTTLTDAKVIVPSLITSDADRNAPKNVFDTKPEGV